MGGIIESWELGGGEELGVCIIVFRIGMEYGGRKESKIRG